MFTDVVFILVILPLIIVVNLICRSLDDRLQTNNKYCDLLIILASILYYALVDLHSIVFLITYFIAIWIWGGIIEKHNRNTGSKLFVSIGVIFAIFVLISFKYIPHSVFSLSTPLGISFITFSVISYFVDIYNGARRGSMSNTALYFSFFPKIASGPIMTWDLYLDNNVNRKMSLEKCISGIERIVIGLSKKVILADYFGATIDYIDSLCVGKMDVPTAWLICLLYMFQIYYDFSGYTDIALGISSVLGFSLPENFDFPYLSASIGEFWQRWHMSLGSWLKKYVYIPLGGNRKGKGRTCINLFIVFLLSGAWHGVGLVYIIWGAIHGTCIVIERVLKNKIQIRLPKMVRWLMTMFVVMMGWEIFRLDSMEKIKEFIPLLIGHGSGDVVFSWMFFAGKKLVIMLIIAVFGATGMYRLRAWFKDKDRMSYKVFEYIGILCLYIIVIVVKINSSYSPFIYSRF